MLSDLPDYIPNLEKAAHSLIANNMGAHRLTDAAQALAWVKAVLRPGSSVAIGGSNTLRDIGVTSYIENGDFRYTNRYVKGVPFQLDKTLPAQVIERSYLDAFTADFYLTSTNALTEQGELVNVDGLGNRVAAMSYGPKTVILVAGRNKVVPDLSAAFERLGQIISRGGMGVQRTIETPCRKIGRCINCKSENRPCCTYSIMRFQKKQSNCTQARIQVLLVDEDLGF